MATKTTETTAETGLGTVDSTQWLAGAAGGFLGSVLFGLIMQYVMPPPMLEMAIPAMYGIEGPRWRPAGRSTSSTASPSGSRTSHSSSSNRCAGPPSERKPRAWGRLRRPHDDRAGGDRDAAMALDGRLSRRAAVSQRRDPRDDHRPDRPYNLRATRRARLRDRHRRSRVTPTARRADGAPRSEFRTLPLSRCSDLPWTPGSNFERKRYFPYVCRREIWKRSFM